MRSYVLLFSFSRQPTKWVLSPGLLLNIVLERRLDDSLMLGWLKNDALLFMAAIAESFPELHVPILSFFLVCLDVEFCDFVV